jgi:hypothetical protein
MDMPHVSIDTAVNTAFHRWFGGPHYAAAWIICEWGRVMASARESARPDVKADRLRAAAEYRAEIAREKNRVDPA